MQKKFPLPCEAAICFTYRCNLSCSSGFGRNCRNPATGREIPLESWLNFIDELFALQVLYARIIGGEVLAHAYFRPLVERIASGNMRFRLVSNGTLMDRETVRFLVGTGRCERVQLSLDGLEPYHDSVRGRGTFRKVIAAIGMLADAGMRVTVHSVICRENYADAPAFARFLETLPLESYRFDLRDDVPGGPCGSGTRLTLEELIGLSIELAFHAGELPRLSPGSFPVVLIGNLRHPRPDSGRCGGCAASRQMFGTRPDGAVTACSEVSDPVVGFIGETPLQEIWYGPAFEDFRRRSSEPAERNDPECRDCPYFYECRKFCFLADGEYYCRKKMAALLTERGVRI